MCTISSVLNPLYQANRIGYYIVLIFRRAGFEPRIHLSYEVILIRSLRPSSSSSPATSFAYGLSRSQRPSLTNLILDVGIASSVFAYAFPQFRM